MAKVLVVEDNPLNMELVVEILRSQGFDVGEAKDGAEARRKAEKEVYDLIIMDIGLPDMDGVEVAKLIRSLPEYKFKPVVALTAFAMKGDKERFLKEGFDAYVSKPLNVAEFAKLMEKYRE